MRMNCNARRSDVILENKDKKMIMPTDTTCQKLSTLVGQVRCKDKKVPAVMF